MKAELPARHGLRHITRPYRSETARQEAIIVARILDSHQDDQRDAITFE